MKKSAIQGIVVLLKGQIHLVLNKNLMDDTSIKQAQIKTFLCVLSNFVETWCSCSTPWVLQLHQVSTKLD